MRHKTALLCLASQSLQRHKNYFKAWLTYQKQLFKSCVRSLDILQRWKAAGQVLHLHEFIGSFANCLIDSKSNHQEIKTFCFTSQIMHQLLLLEDEVNRYCLGNSCNTETHTVWKANGLHAFLNAYKLMTSLAALKCYTGKVIFEHIWVFKNITSITWFLLLLF